MTGTPGPDGLRPDRPGSPRAPGSNSWGEGSFHGATPEEMGVAVIAALRARPGAPPDEAAQAVPVQAAPGQPALWSSTVMLRPIASGLPFGFFALVVAAVIVGAQAYGFLPASAGVAIGLVLFPTVLAQLVAGVSAILGRTTIGAALMMTFSGVWLGTALVYVARPHDGLVVLAIWYAALGAVILCLISSATGKLALAFVPMTGLPAFMVTCAWLLTGDHALGEAAGVLTFVLAAAGLYAAVALLFEDSRRRTVLPTLRRGPMKEAFTGDLPAQLRGVEHEGGVRRYL